MIIISHEAAAELIFAAGLCPATVTEAGKVVAAEYVRRHGNLAEAAADALTQYAEHWETAAARMRRCLAIAPTRVELPDSYGPDPLAIIGCEGDECTSQGPYTPVGGRLYCLPCAARALLEEAAGPEGDEMEDERG